MAAVAVKVVTATGNVEVEELQKNRREFEGGSGLSAEARFVVLLTELASVKIRRTLTGRVGRACHQV